MAPRLQHKDFLTDGSTTLEPLPNQFAFTKIWVK